MSFVRLTGCQIAAGRALASLSRQELRLGRAVASQLDRAAGNRLVPGAARRSARELRADSGMQADGEKDRVRAVRGECCEHCLRILGPGAVVECKHYLAFAQERWLLNARTQCCSGTGDQPRTANLADKAASR
jgi:hypothetical protein